MSTGLLTAYIGMLKDPSVPANRVVRKVAALAVAGVCGLAYHGILGFGSWERALITIFLTFIVVMAFGIGGGVCAGAFYKTFLRKVDARNSEPSLTTFFAECLFAVVSPLFALFFLNLLYPVFDLDKME